MTALYYQGGYARQEVEQALLAKAQRRQRIFAMIRHGTYATIIVSLPVVIAGGLYLTYYFHGADGLKALLSNVAAGIGWAMAAIVVLIFGASFIFWWKKVFEHFQNRLDVKNRKRSRP